MFARSGTSTAGIGTTAAGAAAASCVFLDAALAQPQPGASGGTTEPHAGQRISNG